MARAAILMQAFCNTRSDFHMEKTAYKGLELVEIVPHENYKDI